MNLRSNIVRSALISNLKLHGKVTECVLRGTCGYIPEEYLDSVTVSGICSLESTPTPDNPIDIVCNNGYIKWDSGNQEIYYDGTSEQVQDSAGNTALAEPLLACGDYKDTQEILSGVVTRRIGVKVLDGTEDWFAYNTGAGYRTAVQEMMSSTDGEYFCTHVISINSVSSEGIRFGANNNVLYWCQINTTFTTVDIFKAWLAEQYTNGTPVIIVYPLATETTESVTPQILKKPNVTRVADAPITWTTSNHTTPTMDMPLKLLCNNGPIVFSGNSWSVDSEHGEICKFIDRYHNVVESPWLLGCGGAYDTYNPLTDTISRCMNVVQFDGSESWTRSAEYTFAITKSALSSSTTYWPLGTAHQTLCSHTTVINDTGSGITFTNTNISADSVEAWASFLAAQKTAGTPVTLVYPKAPVVTNNALNAIQLVYKGPLTQTLGSLSMSNYLETNIPNMPILKWKMSDLGINLEDGESQALPANSYLYNGHYYTKEVIVGYLDNDTWLEEEGGSELTLPDYECYLYDGTTWYEYDTITWEELNADPHNDNSLGNVLGVNGYIVGDNATLHQIDHYEYKEGMLMNLYVSLTVNDNITIGKVSGHGTLKVIVSGDVSGTIYTKWNEFDKTDKTKITERTITTQFEISTNIQTIEINLSSTGLVYTDLQISFNTDVKVYAIIWLPDNYFWSLKDLYDNGKITVSNGETKKIMSCYKLNFYGQNLTNTNQDITATPVLSSRNLADGTYICWGAIFVPMGTTESKLAFIVDVPSDGTLQFSGNHYYNGFNIVITDLSTGEIIVEKTPENKENNQIHVSATVNAGHRVQIKLNANYTTSYPFQLRAVLFIPDKSVTE